MSNEQKFSDIDAEQLIEKVKSLNLGINLEQVLEGLTPEGVKARQEKVRVAIEKLTACPTNQLAYTLKRLLEEEGDKADHTVYFNALEEIGKTVFLQALLVVPRRFADIVMLGWKAAIFDSVKVTYDAIDKADLGKIIEGVDASEKINEAAREILKGK